MYENIAVANINKAVNGIELKFDSKPSYEVLRDLKENGFRWHNKKQLWYGRNTAVNVRAVEKYVDLNASDVSFGVTPDGTVDVRALRNERLGVSSVDVNENSVSGVGNDKGTASPAGKPKNDKLLRESEKPACIADFYDSVGRAGIYADSTVEGSLWSSIGSKGYYADINAYIWCTCDSACVIELDNAMKRGKECKVYSIYSRNKESPAYLVNDCKVKTPKELYDLVRSGNALPGDGELSVRERKGVEVFSPFVAVKPLDKLPEKWKKSDLVKAIMSGQVFSGVLDERLTDDYAYDAAVNFGAGRPIDLPGQAADLVEGCRDPYIHTDGVDEKGIASVHFSYGGDMKTFLFDVNCDLAESIRRREVAARELEAHNQEIKKSVKKFSVSDIDVAKTYVVDKVVKDSNTGKLSVESEIVQGFALVDLLDYEQITGLRQAEFVPGKLYQIAGFFNRRDYAEEDERIVDIGNWGQVCSGKAFEELTQEGVFLRVATPDYENPKSFENVKKLCMDFISGKQAFMFGNSVDYSKSLKKLEDEEKRLVQDKSVKRELKSLADIIGFAEVKKEFEKNQNGSLSFNHFQNER